MLSNEDPQAVGALETPSTSGTTVPGPQATHTCARTGRKVWGVLNKGYVSGRADGRDPRDERWGRGTELPGPARERPQHLQMKTKCSFFIIPWTTSSDKHPAADLKARSPPCRQLRESGGGLPTASWHAAGQTTPIPEGPQEETLGTTHTQPALTELTAKAPRGRQSHPRAGTHAQRPLWST